MTREESLRRLGLVLIAAKTSTPRLIIQTEFDSVDGSERSVTATVQAGTGYVTWSPSSATPIVNSQHSTR